MINQPPNLPSSSSASVRGGMWYVFFDGDDCIRAWSSSWTGLERVYINERLLGRSHHLRRMENFAFEHNCHQYRVHCTGNPHTQWQANCSLWKDGKCLQTLRCKRRKLFSGRPAFAHLAACVLLGLISGLVAVPSWFGWVFVCVSLLLTIATTAKTQNFIIVEDPPQPTESAAYPA